MTAVCGGGVSAPNLGATLNVGIGSAYIAQLLETGAGGFWQPAVPFLVVPNILLSSFCASDPPAYPSFTSAEANALLHLTFGADFVSGLPKLVQLVERLIWFDNCYCQTGTLTPNTSVPPAPGGTYVITQPTPQPTTPCATATELLTLGIGTFSILIPGLNPLVTNATSFTVRLQLQQTGGTATSVTMHWGFDVNGVADQSPTTPNFTWNGATTVDTTLTYNVPRGTTAMRFDYTGTGGTQQNNCLFTYNVYCGVGPGGVSQSCCPPDQTTQSLLNAILAMATLIQRQVAPFAYVPGGSVTGLSGSGEVSVQSVLGVKITPSTIPPQLGVTPGDPDTNWLSSWIRWGNADGWAQREFLTAAPFVSIPPLAGQYTRIGYTLHPGLVIDLEQLVREP